VLDHDSRSERSYLGNQLVAELGVQTLQSSLPACLKTPDLQAGSRVTSHKVSGTTNGAAAVRCVYMAAGAASIGC